MIDLGRLAAALVLCTSLACDGSALEGPATDSQSDGDSGDDDSESPATGDDDETATKSQDPSENDDASESATDDEEIPPLSGACSPQNRLGRFLVDRTPDETLISGNVRDAVLPTALADELDSAGDCTLWRTRTAQCEESCESDETCHPDEGCVAFPTALSVGNVSVSGMFEAIELEPRGDSKQYFETGLDHPAFDEGARLTITAEGDELAGFALHGMGVPGLELDAEDGLAIAPDAAFEVVWPAVDPDLNGADQIRMRLQINVDQHGSSPAHIECELADEGRAEVPRSLVAALFDLGISGFPSLSLSRGSLDSVELDEGCIEFEVAGRQTLPLLIEGHVPCETDADCPEGQSCNTTLETCE